MSPKPFYDAREQPVRGEAETGVSAGKAPTGPADMVPSKEGDRRLSPDSAVLPFPRRTHPDNAASRKAARDAQRTAREAAIAANLREGGMELHREQLQDAEAVTNDAIGLGQAILNAEARTRHVRAKDVDDLPLNDKHALVRDGVVALRLRRPVWRRLATDRVRHALLQGLQEHCSHAFYREYGTAEKAEQAMQHVAIYLSGPLFTAAVETLSGRLDVTAREFTAATLDFLPQEKPHE